MTTERPVADAARARDYLSTLAKRTPTDPAVLAQAAAAHATLALHDRVGALLEHLLRKPTVGEALLKADRDWLEEQKRAAIARGDAPSIRRATDLMNQANAASRYVDSPTAHQRAWSNVVHDPVLDERDSARADDIEQVRRVEAELDPDIAESNRQLRQEAAVTARADSQERQGVGIFGQMAAPEGEDG